MMSLFKGTKQKKHNRRIIRRGVGLFETILATIVSLVVAGQLVQQINDSEQSIKSTTTALKIRTLTDAAGNYVKANQVALMSQMSDGQIVKLPITGAYGPVNDTKSMQNAGVIPPNYNFNLPYQQQPLVLIRRVAVPANQTATLGQSRLEAMVTTYGGTSYDDRMLGQIIQKIGVRGGAIMNTVFPNVARGTLQGAYGSWHYSPSDWSTGPYPITCGQPKRQDQSAQAAITCGRPVGIVTNMKQDIGDYLDRYDVGNSEANTMHTNIDADNYNFLNTNTVDGVKGQNLYMSSSDSRNNIITPKNLHVCTNTNSNTYDCGLILGTSNTTLTNTSNGWTTLTQNMNGFHITGGSSNLELSGALMLDATRGGSEYNAVPNNRPSGLFFAFNIHNWNVGNLFGAHLFQNNAEYLTLSGGNGFSGFDIEPTGGYAARIQLLNSQIYGDNNGLLSIRTGDYNGGVFVKHSDGTQADVSSDAINLGTSTARSENGQTYPAIIGEACAPNGRLAAAYQGHGEVRICYNGQWQDVSNTDTHGKPKFSNLIYSDHVTQTYTNTTGKTLFVVIRVPNVWDNRREVKLSNGTIPCVINKGGIDYNWSSETCSFLMPTGTSINNTHWEWYQSGTAYYCHHSHRPSCYGPIYSQRQVYDMPPEAWYYMDIYE